MTDSSFIHIPLLAAQTHRLTTKLTAAHSSHRQLPPGEGSGQHSPVPGLCRHNWLWPGAGGSSGSTVAGSEAWPRPRAPCCCHSGVSRQGETVSDTPGQVHTSHCNRQVAQARSYTQTARCNAQFCLLYNPHFLSLSQLIWDWNTFRLKIDSKLFQGGRP